MRPKVIANDGNIESETVNALTKVLESCFRDDNAILFDIILALVCYYNTSIFDQVKSHFSEDNKFLLDISRYYSSQSEFALSYWMAVCCKFKLWIFSQYYHKRDSKILSSRYSFLYKLFIMEPKICYEYWTPSELPMMNPCLNMLIM